MTDFQPITHCKNCKYWPRGLWDYPCRACNNEGRGCHPMIGDVMKNHFKRSKWKPVYTQPKSVEDKRREMGL